MSRQPKKSGDEGVDFLGVLHLLREHLWVIVACTAVCTGLALIHVARKAPVYVSRAVLEVSEDSNSFSSLGRQSGSDLNSATLLKTIEQTVASQSVLRRVLETEKLAEDPTFAPPRKNGAPYSETELIELLAHRIEVGLVRGTRLISLSAWDHDPAKAQRLAQAVIDEFFVQKLEANREGTDSARQYLTAEAMRVKDELSASEERLQLYREQHNAVSLSERHNLVMSRLSDLSQQVTKARADRLALETEKTQIEALQKIGGDALLDIRVIAGLPEVVELTKELNRLGAENAALSQRYRDKHPRMIESRRQLEETRLGLHTTLQRAGDAIVQSYRTARANEEMLQLEFEQQEKLAMELSRLSIPYRALEREAESNQILYQQVLARLKEADVTQNLLTRGNVEGSRIRVTQQPLVPVRPSGMSKKSC